jgi:hypothetical protein
MMVILKLFFLCNSHFSWLQAFCFVYFLRCIPNETRYSNQHNLNLGHGFSQNIPVKAFIVRHYNSILKSFCISGNTCENDFTSRYHWIYSVNLNSKGEYRLLGGLIKVTNSSTILRFLVTIPTEQGW